MSFLTHPGKKTTKTIHKHIYYIIKFDRVFADAIRMFVVGPVFVCVERAAEIFVAECISSVRILF